MLTLTAALTSSAENVTILPRSECWNRNIHSAIEARGPNRVGAHLILPEDGNKSSFQNVVF
jgi:hypothetical protein